MNRARILIILLFAGLVTAATFGQAAQVSDRNQTSGQQANSQQDPVSMRLDRMSHMLNLSEDQKSQIEPILQDEVQQAQAIRQDASLTPEQKRGKMLQLRDSSRARVEAVLTPEQVARMPRRGAGRRMARMAQRLNLTADQKAKMKPLMVGQHKQVQAVRADASLTPEQKQDKIREIRTSTHRQVMALLTPEQQQQLKQMRGRWRGHGAGHGMGQQPSSAQPQPQP